MDDDFKKMIDLAVCEVLADEKCREAVARLVPDMGVIAARVVDIWPRYSGQLLTLAVKASMK